MAYDRYLPTPAKKYDERLQAPKYDRYLQAPKKKAADNDTRFYMQQNDRYYNWKHARNYNPRIVSDNPVINKINDSMARWASRLLEEKVWAAPKRNPIDRAVAVLTGKWYTDRKKKKNVVATKNAVTRDSN